jgi:hypothetical protein
VLLEPESELKSKSKSKAAVRKSHGLLLLLYW